MNTTSSIFAVPLVCVGLLGALTVPSHAATYTVTTLNDSGKGSLRQAVIDSNAKPDADTITFSPKVKGNLILKTGELAVSSDVSIVGPGANVLTVSGGNTTRLFNIVSGTVALSGLTLANGLAKGGNGVDGQGTVGKDAAGGAIFNRGTLILTDCSLLNNSAFGGEGEPGTPGNYTIAGHGGPGGQGGAARGGAIFSIGSLKAVRTRFEGNVAQGGDGGPGGRPANGGWYYGSSGPGGAAYGGAVYSVNTSLEGVTFLNNRAVGGAGGKSGRPSGPTGAPSKGLGNDTYDGMPHAQDATFTGMVSVAFQGKLISTGENLTYSLASGTLPAGLELDPVTGEISGTPTQPARGQRITFKVSDQLGVSTVAVVTFNIQAASVLNVNKPSVREGNGSEPRSQLVFTLTRSQDVSRSASVMVQTGDASNSSATAKSDYVPLKPTRITFAPGQIRQTVAIAIVGDALHEVNEAVALQLSDPMDMILGQTSAEGTILNDDPLPTISINDVSVQEGNRNYSKATFTVTLSSRSDRTIHVGYQFYSNGAGAALGGAASTPNVDYLAIAPSTLFFAPGQTSRTITVVVKGDTVLEGDESFLVKLTSPVNARISDGKGVGTILNDDSTPSPAQSSASGGNS